MSTPDDIMREIIRERDAARLRTMRKRANADRFRRATEQSLALYRKGN